jgi:hypothetical protein
LNVLTLYDFTMWSLLSGLSLALLLSQVQALYFYIDGPTQKCFFEELPKDTLVVGKETTSTEGRYSV